jgi:hypothetical protein
MGWRSGHRLPPSRRAGLTPYSFGRIVDPPADVLVTVVGDVVVFACPVRQDADATRLAIVEPAWQLYRVRVVVVATPLPFLAVGCAHQNFLEKIVPGTIEQVWLHLAYSDKCERPGNRAGRAIPESSATASDLDFERKLTWNELICSLCA